MELFLPTWPGLKLHNTIRYRYVQEQTLLYLQSEITITNHKQYKVFIQNSNRDGLSKEQYLSLFSFFLYISSQIYATKVYIHVYFCAGTVAIYDYQYFYFYFVLLQVTNQVYVGSSSFKQAYLNRKVSRTGTKILQYIHTNGFNILFLNYPQLRRKSENNDTTQM